MDQLKEALARRPLRPHRAVWSVICSLAPVLAPFLVSLTFIAFFCGPNLPRGLAILKKSQLRLASGPKFHPELGPEGRRMFYTYDLGAQIAQTIRHNCSSRPELWSLDYWVNPDSKAWISVDNKESAGTRDSIARLSKDKEDPEHVDLAILQDGLIADGELKSLSQAKPDRIKALVPLYKSVFCVFVRNTAPYRSTGEMRGHRVRAYLGMEGSGARYLTKRVLKHAGLDCVDLKPDWSPNRVAAAMTSKTGEGENRSGEGDQFDVAFVLDKIDSGVIRNFARSGQYHLASVDGVDDLLRDDRELSSSLSIRRADLGKGSLSEQPSVPARKTETIVTQTILACSADLPDWDAFRITQTLNENFRFLGLGSETAAHVPQFDPSLGASPWTVYMARNDPGMRFDYPIHDGAARYYRSAPGAKADGFPYQALVVAIGASVALAAYWQTLALKRRADRLARRVDTILTDALEEPDNSDHAARELDKVKVKAILHYKDGRLNKEGYERINEYIRIFQKILGGREVESAEVQPAYSSSHRGR